MFDTERLTLRHLNAEDAPFIHQLVNEPAWLRFIGDKNIRTLDDARNYILNGPVAMYQKFGFGLWLVQLKQENLPIGICGLIKRDTLEDIDLGFAFLESHWRRGYALESTGATISYAKETLALRRVVAIMSPGNDPSARLLEKLGFRFERKLQLTATAPEILLYAVTL